MKEKNNKVTKKYYHSFWFYIFSFVIYRYCIKMIDKNDKNDSDNR